MINNINKFIVFLVINFIPLSSNVIGQNNQKLLEKLSKDSEIIVVGKVSSQESFWNKSKTRIYSKVNINSYEYIKGNDLGNEITIDVLGGEIDGVGELYSHMPKFDNNEEVLLFMKKDQMNSLSVTGGEIGKMRLMRDKDTGKLTTSSKKDLLDLKNEIKLYSDK